jgi:hypothetical protein
MWAVWLLIVGLLSGKVLGQDDEKKFFFFWPTVTTQCQVSPILVMKEDAEETQIIDLTWADATPPFTAYIMYVLILSKLSYTLTLSPIYSRPFIYDIPDDAYSNGQGRYTVSPLPPNYATPLTPRSSFNFNKAHTIQCSCLPAKDSGQAARQKFKWSELLHKLNA